VDRQAEKMFLSEAEEWEHRLSKVQGERAAAVYKYSRKVSEKKKARMINKTTPLPIRR